MPRKKVKDMPRKQQMAVKAAMAEKAAGKKSPAKMVSAKDNNAAIKEKKRKTRNKVKRVVQGIMTGGTSEVVRKLKSSAKKYMAQKTAKNAIKERNKTTRLQIAPPQTYDQYIESMYGKGVRNKDLSGSQQRQHRGDYIKAMEDIAYVDTSKKRQPNRFHQGFSEDILPTGYFQSNRRRYKTGGLVIAQEEANSNRPRGARKELKGTKFKGVF